MVNKKNTVLIIEDESELRQLLKTKLKNEGFNVLEADDGKVGLETALSKHPDIILLDIIMPVMDGLSMLKELRQNVWGKTVAFIVLSNLSEAEKISEGMEKNAYGYLVKSDWEPDDVVALIRKKLEVPGE
jgi:DNA-binding response OmpR family regulator